MEPKLRKNFPSVTAPRIASHACLPCATRSDSEHACSFTSNSPTNAARTPSVPILRTTRKAGDDGGRSTSSDVRTLRGGAGRANAGFPGQDADHRRDVAVADVVLRPVRHETAIAGVVEGELVAE